jgi:hypothetical protein
VSGFSVINGGASSTFAILATSFTIAATGLADVPMFKVATVNGATQVSIDGVQMADLSLLNAAIANNAVSNSAISIGNGAGSGNATISVRNGDRIRLSVQYAGLDQIANGFITDNAATGWGAAGTEQAKWPVFSLLLR